MNKKDNDQNPSPSLSHQADDLLHGETKQNPKPEICQKKPEIPKKIDNEPISSKHKPEKDPSSILDFSPNGLSIPFDDEKIESLAQEEKIEPKETGTPLEPVVSQGVLAFSEDEAVEFESKF